jgi:hypothetical protein
MKSFLGKLILWSLGIYLLGTLHLSAQVIAASDTQEFIITQEENRASLFAIINKLKQDHGIKTQFKKYKQNGDRLTVLELEFTDQNNDRSLLSVDNDSGIRSQSIKVNKAQNSIAFIGEATNTAASQNTAIATGPTYKLTDQPLKSAKKAAQQEIVSGKRTTSTYSIQSKTVTDTSELKKSQVDDNDPASVRSPQSKTSSNTNEGKGKSVNQADAVDNSQPAAQSQKEDQEQLIESLQAMQDIKQRQLQRQAAQVLKSGHLFLNARQYFYEVYPGTTMIYDQDDNAILKMEAQLDGPDQEPQTGVIPIRGVRYKYKLQGNVLTLRNKDNLLVDHNGVAIKR